MFVFFFQAEDGIRYLVRSRGLGDVYKRQEFNASHAYLFQRRPDENRKMLSSMIYEWTAPGFETDLDSPEFQGCLLYTSDAADERSSVDLGGRRIINKKKNIKKTKKKRKNISV